MTVTAKCIAVIFEDMSFQIVPWEDINNLSNEKNYLQVRVIRVIDGVEFADKFDGKDILGIRFTPAGLILTGGTASPNTLERYFRAADPTVSFNKTKLANGLYLTAGAGSNVAFYSYDGPDFDDKLAQANAVDVGACV